MSEVARPVRAFELSLIVLSCAAVASVVLANVIRVAASAEVAFFMRAALFAGCWVAGFLWTGFSKERCATLWLLTVAIAGALMAVCQRLSGGVSVPDLVQIIGPAGAGLGAAILLKSAMQGGGSGRLATTAAAFGVIAAVWLALEPHYGLWKLLPNDWEISKNLNYRWGIRMGQDRARFLFETPMEAGVVQWFCGVLCLVAAIHQGSRSVPRSAFGVLALGLFASVVLTYSRAGLVLAAFSAGLVSVTRIKNKNAVVAMGGLAVCAVLVAGIAASRWNSSENPIVRNVASILDPTEEANQIRLSQFAKAGSDLAATPWHGRGAGSFVTFADAPRLPEHESSPVNLISSFGLGGLAIVLAFAMAYVRHTRRFAETIFPGDNRRPTTFDILVVAVSIPFAVYSLVSPIFAGMIFGMICFTIMGLLAVWDTPLGASSGKP